MSGRNLTDLDALKDRLSGQHGPRLWRSLEELANSPDVRRYVEAEFPDVARAAPLDRRTLMRLMGASLALGGLGACRRAETDAPLLSQSRNVPGYTPGVPLMIATSLELNGYGRGVLVETQEGRPTKIEGNAVHPASLGATDVFAQAEILGLYDPDRSRAPSQDGVERTWDELIRFIRPVRNELVVDEGRGLHVLMPPVASPTLHRLTSLAAELFPHAEWHSFAPVGEENRRAGARAVFGRDMDAVYNLAQVDVLVTLGGDLFAEEPGHIRHAADFQARRRAADRPLPRLVAAESRPSLVGARADERLPLRPRDIESLAESLAAALGLGVPQRADRHPAAARIADDLRRAGPRGLIVAGREQPPRVHALAFAINARLGAFGTTIRAIAPLTPSMGARPLADLAEALATERVSHLVVLGGNPVYSAPADFDLATLVGRVPLSLHLGYHSDETARACRWHIPERHGLEGWGDLRAFDGTVGFRQPSVLPLTRSLSAEAFLGLLIGQTADARALVEATWRDAWADGFDERWRRALEAGVVENSASPSLDVAVQSGWDAGSPAVPPSGLIDIVFAPDPCIWDGRYANNAWLQELPKPLTKQVWGNAALIAPETASGLGLVSGDAVEMSIEGRSIQAPVWLMPGHAPDTVTLPLGYGREHAGHVGSGIGFNAYAVRPLAHPWITGGSIRATGQRLPVVTTQHHHALQGQDIVRTVAPEGAQDAGDPDTDARPSIYPEWSYDGHAWGMAIDLDACIGCNACMVACQAENNVPVVGPEEVARGRDMHWLRVDRYYAGAPDGPRTYFQPVPCMHCEKAPCEVVCPVNATVHSSEGLNDMVYNRCIGTRTCSNNCPYKVRRFNFFDYQHSDYAPSPDALNPQVSVRDRGVMEKCTYCVQRIGAARAEAHVEGRPIRDGEIMTACQQACPTRAIVFGDINDPKSAVSRLKRSPRNYALLGDLNTQPRTTYLARVEQPPRRASTPAEDGS